MACIKHHRPMTENVYPLTLTAQDGRELRTLAWFPTEECRRDFYDKAAERGLTVTENK